MFTSKAVDVMLFSSDYGQTRYEPINLTVGEIPVVVILEEGRRKHSTLHSAARSILFVAASLEDCR